MLKNYFIAALRNIRKFKAYSFINIYGLAVGMACAILILLYVQHELSYDKFNKNHDRIYRLVSERKTPQGITRDITSPPPLAEALMTDYPQIKTVRFLNIDNPVPLVKAGANRFYEKQFFFADPGVLDLFTIPLVTGDAGIALSKPNTIVISETAAEKYFGSANPVGKILTFNNMLDLEVTGVFKNLPSNSTLRFDFLVSFSTLQGWLGKEFVENWHNNMCQTYLMLPENLHAKSFTAQLPAFINKHFDKSNNLKQIYLQPLDRIHLYSSKDYDLASGGDISYIYLLTAIAFFVLAIACFNYMSLTISQFTRRSKEIGVRKLIGAVKKQLVAQFIIEGTLSIVISLCIAILLISIAVPYFNKIVGVKLEFNSGSIGTIILPAAIVFLSGLLSSAYPALVISSFQPITALKGIKNVTSKIGFRKILVVVQFSLTILLITGTWVVYKQLDFIQNKQLGFDVNKVIVVPIRDEEMRQNPEPVKNKLLENPEIQQVSAAALLPGGPVGKTRFRAEGVANTGTMNMLWVDYDFVKTLGIKLEAGRDFSKDFTTDADESFIINEEAVKQLGWGNPADAVGKTFELVGGKKGKIIGVVNDFNFTSLQKKIEPVVMHIWPWPNYILIRTNTTRLTSVIDEIKTAWSEFDSANPFEFSFMNDNFNRYYESIRQLETISTFFTLIAILLACAGLFSMSALISISKTKEIGVRKILGASIHSILIMLSREFVILVLVAACIAAPVSYYVMNNWLENFAYRIDISLWVFIFSGGMALLIALATISWHAIKAAAANPVESLRYE